MGPSERVGDESPFPPTVAATGLQWPVGPSQGRSSGPASGGASGGSQSSHFAGNRDSLRELIQRFAHDARQPIVERYKLLEEIGFGGFGVVWKAQSLDAFDDEQTEDFVAVKFFVAGDGTRADAVLAEVSKMISVKGTTGVLPVKETRANGVPPHAVPYYVMDFAKNGSLQARIEQKSLDDRGKTVRTPTPLPADEAAALLLRVAKTLKFVHERDIVHGDLKPANVLLNEAGEPLLADFGQAQRGAESEGQGTFFYMAPERATVERIKPDPRWDVFSFGALAYALLTGTAPWWTRERFRAVNEPRSKREKFERYRKELFAAKPPSAHHAVCDAALAAVIDRCLAAAPASRPKDGAAIVALLENRIAARRKKPLLAYAAAITLGVLVLAPVVSWFAGQTWIASLNERVTGEVQNALSQQAYLGRAIVEEKLTDRVGFVEHMTTDEARCPREFRVLLAGIGDKLKGRAADPREAITEPERAIADDWIAKTVFPVLVRRHPSDHKSLALFVVVPDGASHRGFVLSRVGGHVEPDGTLQTTTPRSDRDGPNASNYGKDWSFRDYFSGAGNDFTADKAPHDVVRTTHISHSYRSQAVEKDGKTYPWRIDVSAPIWERPGAYDAVNKRAVEPKDVPGNRVVGLLVCGLDVNTDLMDSLNVPAGRLPHDGVLTHVNAVLVNDRGRWAWHGEKVRDAFARNTAEARRDPDKLTDPNLVHFLTSPTGDAAFFDDNDFHDTAKDLATRPVAGASGEAPGGPAPASVRHIARGERILPYRTSHDPALRDKAWVFLTEVERASALEPVERIRINLMWWGTGLYALVAALVVGLWAWLVRLLRRTELSTNA
jgi:hypothetical protein